MKKKIVWTILLILLMWMSTYGGNIQTFLNAGYDYDTATSTAMYYGTIGTLILTLIMITIPAICVISQKEKLNFEKGLKLCKWNSLIFLSFCFIIDIFLMGGIYDETFENLGANLVYALMSYFINKWLFVADKDEIKETIKDTNIENESVIVDNKNEEVSQNSSDNKPRKKTLLLLILLVIALIISVIFNIDVYIKLEETNTKISRLEKENKEYENAYEKLSNLYSEEAINNITNSIKVEFYDENIVFVIDGYGDYYYTYDQMEQVTQGIDEYSYWAYNKEQAISLGYKKWK